MNKILAILLMPFSLIYGLILEIRNRLFDIGWLKSYQSSIPSIVVGNLSVGGTGKTPMVELLLKLRLKAKPAVVSRGYGRESKGLLKVESGGKAAQYGDESLQIAAKFPDAQLWVSEKRILGAQAAETAGTDFIIYDDAFQHRYVRGDFHILLSSYDRPYYQDYVLPSGRLRERRKGAKRADCIIITKCPSALSEEARRAIIDKSKSYSKAPVLFTHLRYGKLENNKGEEALAGPVEIISAIAKPQVLIDEVSRHHRLVKSWLFKDHHLFSQKDLEPMLRDDERGNKQFICSEKDYVKLAPLFQELNKLDQLFYLPVEHAFFKDGEAILKSMIEERFSAAQD